MATTMLFMFYISHSHQQHSPTRAQLKDSSCSSAIPSSTRGMPFRAQLEECHVLNPYPELNSRDTFQAQLKEHQQQNRLMGDTYRLALQLPDHLSGDTYRLTLPLPSAKHLSLHCHCNYRLMGLPLLSGASRLSIH
ncbi:hypothetical protein DEO72_LG3g2131 [Vigna unguiculata]|uniref:Uncharacterized protein n=1 Tax=Vigna unguiculata TaxID=3917 RepID=A0A4D6LGG0_VIGUN|nr:hypothetical protein DEO72_LG3g2131 [Vigna unguiculata]